VRRLLPIPVLLLALAAAAPASASVAHFRTPSEGIDALSASQTLHKASAALDGRAGRGDHVTPLLKQLALKLPALSGAERRKARRLLARPTQGQGGPNELEYEVAEQKPICSDHFCVHWVSTTDDAPPQADANGNGVPDYVETMDSVFEHVYAVENGELGWRPPTSDGSKGCNAGAPANCADRTDVYVKELGSQGIYGYAAPDPDQDSFSQAAYLVLDNDYNATQFPRYQGNPLPPMEVTAAHEYNHVLQFGYDTAQDTWMFESSATWMEDRVYTDVNDYLQYLMPWVQMTFVPLTQFNLSDGNDPLNVKVYGDAVWNRWIDRRFGPDTIRDAWAASRKTSPKSFAPAAYDSSLHAKGSGFYQSFSQFAVDTAEWRDSNSAFAEGSTFEDVDRAVSDSTGRPIVLTPDKRGASGTLFHTAYILLAVEPSPGMRQLKLAVSTPRGTKMAIALVGRTGDEVNGASDELVKLLPNGGPSTLTVDDPGRYSRLTAVVVNGDASATRFSRTLGDWLWLKDSQAINVRVSADFTPPAVRRRSPAPGARRASTRSRVKVSFSERMFELSARTVKLIGPGGRSVKARLALTTGGKAARSAAGADKLVLTPAKRLRKGARYTLRLSRDLRDYGGNPLPSSSLKWSFRAKR
jgi:hypothetical protein